MIQKPLTHSTQKSIRRGLDSQFRRDLLKLACLTCAVAGCVGIFFVTPSLSSPTLLSMVATTLLSPWVSAIERRGYSRSIAIVVIFLIFAAAFFLFGVWGIQSGLAEWDSFKEQAPAHFQVAIQKIRSFENDWKSRYPFLNHAHPTDSILQWGSDTGRWFVEHGASLMGEALTWIFIIPPLTFVLLNEGPLIRRRFFQLVPNRYFESCFLITTQIVNSISDYVRAKLIEAILLGTMVTLGLAMLQAPYMLVLGLVAGITNIIPYLGPFLGAVPGVIIASMDHNHPGLALPVGLVFLIANIIDTVVVFPLVVAKLVKLHPLILIAVVMVGQHYYGLIGMLISIPVATAIKVVVSEVYIAVYEQRVDRADSGNSDLLDPLLSGEV